jgi:hypothetical protein
LYANSDAWLNSGSFINTLRLISAAISPRTF